MGVQTNEKNKNKKQNRQNNIHIRVLKNKMSQCKQNFSVNCENAINEQINVELANSYLYMAMAAHFDRDDVALAGFRDYFQKQADEEREHAQKFIKYLNMRVGRCNFESI